MSSAPKIGPNIEYIAEIGRLHFKQGDFKQAIPYLQQATDAFFASRDFQKYCEFLNPLLRIYAEQENFGAIQTEKERLQDLVVRENFKLQPMTYYILGLCSAYREGQEPVAIEYFQKALQLALQNENKVEMAYAVYGLAATYCNMENFDAGYKELQNLEVFFGAVSIPDIEISAKLLMGNIHRYKNQFEKALELYWKCTELLKFHKNLFLSVFALYGIGSTYLRSGEKQMARLYLELAARSVDQDQFPRLMKRIQACLKESGAMEAREEFDLIFESKDNSVVEKIIGKVDFKNQFILLDLLHLFVKNPGKVFPKEVLVRKVWNQEYDPSVHDNKIYVTIKRLRKMIEPDFDKPKYIFRAKNGYFLNKNVRVQVQP